MKCSEMFEAGGVWIVCRNLASVIATDYKHGHEHGICSFCMWRLAKDDDSNFFEHHSFKDI